MRVPDFAEEAEVFAIKNQAHAPFRVAVHGEVSAGKSSFINAFLGHDLALTDVNECTSVRSEFEYGKPELQSRPIDVLYRDGHEEWQEESFRDKLKGKGTDALELAEKVDKLVFRLDDDKLRNMVIIDTPGLNSVVSEHESRALETLGGQSEKMEKLKKRNESEARKMAATADAVVWISNENKLERTAQHLDDFIGSVSGGGQSTGQRLSACNVLVVLTFADQQNSAEERERRKLDAEKQLNMVLPCNVRVLIVSAGIERLLQKLDKAKLGKIRDAVKSSFETESDLEEIALGEIPAGFTRQEWSLMQEGIPWQAFKQAVNILYGAASLDDGIKNLRSLSGFDGKGGLREALENHFASRSDILKCRLITAKFKKALHEMIHGGITRTKQRIDVARRQMSDFTRFVIRHPEYTESTDSPMHKIGEELRMFLSKHNVADISEDAERMINAFLGRLEKPQQHLYYLCMRLDGLSTLEDAWDDLSTEEREELNALFRSEEHTEALQSDFSERSIYWGDRAVEESNPAIRLVASFAKAVYAQRAFEVRTTHNL